MNRNRGQAQGGVQLLYSLPMDQNSPPYQHTDVFTNQEVLLNLSIYNFYLGFHYIGMTDCIFGHVIEPHLQSSSSSRREDLILLLVCPVTSPILNYLVSTNSGVIQGALE